MRMYVCLEDYVDKDSRMLVMRQLKELIDSVEHEPLIMWVDERREGEYGNNKNQVNR